MQNSKRIVVTGIGAITPLGLSAEETWSNMVKGVSGSAPITHFDASRIATKFACELKGFDASEYIDKKSMRRMDLFTQYGIVASEMCLKDAEVDTEKLSSDEKDNFGVIYGSGIGGMHTFEEQTLINLEKGPRRVSPLFIPMMIPDIAAGQISMRYGLNGPNYCTVSACATSNNNIIDSYYLIRNGQADRMLTGGCEAPLLELAFAGFNSARALSTNNEEAETASRPFDKTRDGFVMGEGAGTLMLEDLESAKKRGAKIYAEVIGVGLSADAHHLTAPEPEGYGAILAMKKALKNAGIKPEDVDYINMHGTSTPLGDISETKAIKKVFGDHAHKVSLSSTKSMTGHLLGAAGAVEALASIMAIVDGVIPPTINYKEPDPDCDLDYTVNEAKKREVKISMSNAFGFGGHNTTVVFKKYED